MAFRTDHFGGGNPFNNNPGSPFPVQSARSLGLRSGNAIDALILNGQRFGGTGGTITSELELSPDEYIDDVVIRSDHHVDFLEFRTNRGRTLATGGGSGGRERRRNNIRVLGIGGRSGNVLDVISIRYIENFAEAELIERNQLVVTNIITPGVSIEEIISTEVSTLYAITKIWELVFTAGRGESLEASFDAFIAKITSETSIKATTREEIRTEIRNKVATSQKTTKSPLPGSAIVEVVPVNVYRDGGGMVWFFPTSGARPISVPLEAGIDSNIEVYDLTRTLALQFPSMANRRGSRHGYDFYRTPPSFLQLGSAARLEFLYVNVNRFDAPTLRLP